MENRYKINYDIKKKHVAPMQFKQGDIDSSVLEISLMDNGVAVDITGENIEFRFKKPDETIVYQDSTSGVSIIAPATGKVQCILRSNTLAAPGQVYCEIHRKLNGKELTSPSFYFSVEACIAPTGIVSQNYISSIENMLVSVVAAEAARSLFEAYNAAHSYIVGNKVSYLGSSYQCIAATVGNLPTNASYWILIASKGNIGNTGPAAGFGTPTISATTLPAGSQATASVSASGDDPAKVFNILLGIPRGDTGLNGAGTGDMIAADYVKGTGSGNTKKVDHASYAETVEPNYLLQVPYAGTTTGPANTYAISTPSVATLVTGMAVCIKINVDSTAASTLNWCGLGAKAIKKANGAAVTTLKAGGIYTLRYDGVGFISQGEGASGTATAADLLSGVTAGSDNGDLTGTMANRGAVTITASTTDQTIAAGYHSGSGKVVGDADLVPANIKNGVSIFGVVGSLSGKQFATGTATSSSTSQYFTRSDNSGTVLTKYITVTGLTFKPSMIVVKGTSANHLYDYITLYNEISGGIYAKTCTSGMFSGGDMEGIDLATKGDVSPASVTATGFTLPVSSNTPSGTTMTWFAFE